MVNDISAETLCASIGRDRNQLGPLDDMIEAARTAGLLISAGKVYKAQMAGTGPERFIFCRRSVYRLGDFLEWCLNQARKAEDGPAARGARTRARKRESVGAQERVAA